MFPQNVSRFYILSDTMVKKVALLVILVIVCSSFNSEQLQLDPPLWPQFFQQSFIQTYPNTSAKVMGQLFYNSVTNKMRIDRTDGQFDAFCSSVLPNQSTSCSIVIKDNKKYIYYPDYRICCFCCDKDHGCGLPPPNFLGQSIFMGSEYIGSQSTNKWKFMNGKQQAFYYQTSNINRTPRRFSFLNNTITDMITSSFSKQNVSDAIFAIPSYCSSTCLDTSICGKYRSAYQNDEHEKEEALDQPDLEMQ